VENAVTIRGKGSRIREGISNPRQRQRAGIALKQGKTKHASSSTRGIRRTTWNGNLGEKKEEYQASISKSKKEGGRGRSHGRPSGVPFKGNTKALISSTHRGASQNMTWGVRLSHQPTSLRKKGGMQVIKKGEKRRKGNDLRAHDKTARNGGRKKGASSWRRE